MMERLRAMREPLKYVQGRDALLQFQKEMEYMGHRWLFICSRSGYQACHEKLRKVLLLLMITEGMKSLVGFPAIVRLIK